MKASVVASLLFASTALAAPLEMLDKRAVATTTTFTVETVLVYTTVFGDEAPAPSAAAQFFEEPAQKQDTPNRGGDRRPNNDKDIKEPAPAPASVTSSTTQPSPAKVAPTQQTPPEPTTTTISSAAPAESSKVPEPKPDPPATSPPVSGTPSGETFTGGSLTYHPFDGNLGACGTNLQNTDYVVALGASLWGESTHDIMTGASTNKWCGQDIEISHPTSGKSVKAKIMDLCSGCTGSGLDLSQVAWKGLGLEPADGGRFYDYTWKKV